MRRLGTKACLVVVAAALLWLVAAASAMASFPGRNGRIFYSTTDCAVASVNPTGGESRCIARGGFDPAVSPNRKRVVFTSGGGDEVLTVKIDGSGRRQLTHGNDPNGRIINSYVPSFSPNGRTILYVNAATNPDLSRSGNVYVMNTDGSGQRALGSGGSYDPVYSPNGATIAYQSGDGIYLMNADGSGAHRILADTNVFAPTTGRRELTTNREANFSPGGRQIVFTRTTRTSTPNGCSPFPNCTGGQTSDTQVDVYVMNADGSGERRLTANASAAEEDPFFSPDGTKIAYYRLSSNAVEGNQGDIFVMNADGGAQHRLVHGVTPEWTSVPALRGRPRVTLSGLPSHQTCKRQDFTLRIGVQNFKSRPVVSVYIDGKRVAKKRRTRLSVRIHARKAHAGIHFVRVVAKAGKTRASRGGGYDRCQ